MRLVRLVVWLWSPVYANTTERRFEMQAGIAFSAPATDREQPNFRSSYPGGGGYAGFAYNVGYARAMLQAALPR